MKNRFKKNQIKVNGKSVFIQKNGTVTQLHGGEIFCGDCCKKHNLKPSSRNKEDTEKAIGINAIFHISEDKTKIICKNCGREIPVSETYETMQKQVDEQNKKDLENLHIIKVAESWETGICYYGLSARIDYDDWLKVKEYFHYHTASMDVDDEFYGQAPRGWVCRDYHKVEEILNIPLERTYDYLVEEYRKKFEESERREKELQNRIDECTQAFDNAEKPKGEHIQVEGEVIENPNYPMNIYGGGQWWVIQEDYIWFVRNNGFDGGDWGLNNVATGGAGAIGVRVPYNESLANKIRGLV